MTPDLTSIASQISLTPLAAVGIPIALVGSTRTFAQVLSPAVAGTAIQVAAYGLPFFLTAGLKLAFLGLLYAGWRNRPAEHETAGP